jgi:hypothetical protein
MYILCSWSDFISLLREAKAKGTICHPIHTYTYCRRHRDTHFDKIHRTSVCPRTFRNALYDVDYFSLCIHIHVHTLLIYVFIEYV